MVLATGVSRQNMATSPEQIQTTEKRGYLHDITTAKGLAIFLVVFGHIVTGPSPADNEWYTVLRTTLYAFHMPFFIYLSGYIFFYTSSHLRARKNYGIFFLRRGERLLIPFILFGLLIIAGKHVAEHFIHVDNVAPNLMTDLVNLFWNTGQSAAKSVWYVFVLFEMTLLAVVAFRIIPSPLPLFIIALPLSVLPMVPVLYLDRLFLFLPFFFFGGVAIMHQEKWVMWLDRYLWAFWLAFAGAIIVTRIVGNFHFSLIACGLTSIPALHGLCRLASVQSVKLLDIFGRYSFPIYLFNTIAIGLAKGVMLLLMPWDGINFLIFLPVLLIAGIAGPIFVKAVLLRRVRYLDKISE